MCDDVFLSTLTQCRNSPPSFVHCPSAVIYYLTVYICTHFYLLCFPSQVGLLDLEINRLTKILFLLTISISFTVLCLRVSGIHDNCYPHPPSVITSLFIGLCWSMVSLSPSLCSSLLLHHTHQVRCDSKENMMCVHTHMHTCMYTRTYTHTHTHTHIHTRARTHTHTHTHTRTHTHIHTRTHTHTHTRARAHCICLFVPIHMFCSSGVQSAGEP